MGPASCKHQASPFPHKRGACHSAPWQALAKQPGNTCANLASERAFTMPEVRDAAAEGRLLEVFGAGTAAVICPVNEIFYESKSVAVPSGAGAGPVASALWTKIADIQYGRTPSDWAVAV